MVQESTGYTPFKIVHGRWPVKPVDLALGYEGWDFYDKVGDYANAVRERLNTAREVSREKVNQCYDIQAPRFNEKRLPISYHQGQLVFEWKPVGERA